MRDRPLPLLFVVAGAAAVALVLLGVWIASPDAQPPPPRTTIAGDAHGPEPLEEGPQADAPEPPDPQPGPAAPLRDPDRTAVVWASGGLPDGMASRVRGLDSVDRATIVRGGLLELKVSRDAAGEVVDAPRGNFVIPLDALSVNPSAYADFYSDAEAFAELAPGEALLGETSARLRGIGPGGTLELDDGQVLTVADVVPDELVGGAEVVVDLDTAIATGIARERFVLTLHHGDVEAVDDQLQELMSGEDDPPARAAPAGELRFVRHGSGILTQAQVKERFGEFSYRHSGGDRQVVQDPVWRDEHIVREQVPILGTIRCHREMIPLVRDALAEVVDAGLEHTVDRSGYAGCWNARLTNRLDAVSRHSWGVSIDLNFPDNPVGSVGGMDPELVEIFKRHGFVWGGDWLLTDPTHFEVGEPLGP